MGQAQQFYFKLIQSGISVSVVRSVFVRVVFYDVVPCLSNFIRMSCCECGLTWVSLYLY